MNESNFSYSNKGLRAAIIVLSLAAGLGCANIESHQNEIHVAGRIFILGNEPFTKPAVQLDDGRVLVLAGHKVEELRNYQGKRLYLTGYYRQAPPGGIDQLELVSYRIPDAGE